MSTLAEDLRREEAQLRQRFIYHTRKKGPLTMDEARSLCLKMNYELGLLGPTSSLEDVGE